ncbi:M48 family metallopeptidase [Rubritalea tangerina]|uniref:M48 family metallopeptidase n=2 Tax=Rubritalea tangerina TaxID=430798 RepID=A0ABW4ZFD0_9BACT
MNNTLGIIIVIALFLLWNLDLIATLLNLKALNPKLPSEFKGIFTEDKYAESQHYTRITSQFDIVQSTFSLALTLTFWLLGGFGWLDDFCRSIGYGPILTGLIFMAILFIAQTLIGIPFQIYSTFVIEAKFGFNKTTPKTFVIDQIKGLILMALIGAPILALILWIFGAVAHAWLWAWIAFTLIQLLLTYLAPTYILPLFNKFEPMEDGELKSAINALSAKCDFPLTEIYVMDGSKRSTKSNAFFTGFGKNKKIALFDTLIEKHTTEGLVGVLAHEIGHFKCKHIIQRMVVSTIQTAVIFFLIGIATNPNGAFAQQLFDAFYVEQISTYAGLIFFFILFSPVNKVLSIFSNRCSRKHEFEADAYAANAQGTPEHLIGALKQLSADNLVNLTPHPFLVFLEYSHPPMLTRIDALRRLKLDA